MPYNVQDFKDAGIWEEKLETEDVGDMPTGKDRRSRLSAWLCTRLNAVGGGKSGDASKVDSGVFKSMLEEGLSPEDALATFIASNRGTDARERKDGHFADYVQRTLRDARKGVKRTTAVMPDSRPQKLMVKDMWQSVLDGRLGEVCQNRLTRFPLSYAWPALLTVASVKVPEMHSVRTNLYTSLVGPPGSGKSCIVEHCTRLLNVTSPLLLNLMAGSAEGLFKNIEEAEGEPRLLNPDELSHLLEKASIDRASFPYLLNTAFYNSNFHLVIGKQKDVMFRCRLSLIGGVVEENFEHSFGHSTTGGLHDRFIFGLCPGGYTHQYRPFMGKAETLPEAAAVSLDRDVYEAMDDWRQDGLDARAVENAIRAATICASFDGRKRLQAKALDAARAFARYQTQLKKNLQPNEGLNFDAQCAISIRRRLKGRKDWITRRDLARAIHSNRWGPGVFDRTLRNLELNGEIEQKDTDRGQKLLCIIDDGDRSGDTGDRS
jgi:hypothetical protein